MHYDFGKKYDDCYKNMLKASLPLKKPKKLALFWPVVGKCYQEGEGLLFVGREGNGGFFNIDPSKVKAEDLEQHVNGAKNGVQAIFRSNNINSDCPMSWLYHHREGKVSEKKYNWKKSKFWMVICMIISSKYGWDYRKSDREWWSYCAWSNLYKISPDDDKNQPNPAMYNNQKKYCQDLFKIEIKCWTPRAAIIMVDMGYAVNFFEGLHPLERYSFIEAEGTSQGVPFVITKRPDSRKKGTTNEAFASEISTWLEKL